MQEPLISIIVPIYGVEPYLAECLDSIIGQTYTNLEIILVDDGSPDGCGRICDEYAAEDNRIRVIHQENAGLSAARNRGIELAHGAYLCFVDSDDLLHPAYVSALYTACVQTNADLAMCRFTAEREAMGQKGSPVRAYGPREISMELALDATGVLGVAWNKLYAARVLKDIRFPSGRIHEDEATIYLIYWACQRCAMSEDVLYYYRPRENSIMNRAFSERRMDAALAYRERVGFYQARGEQKLADYTKAVYCHFLRRHLKSIRACTREPKYWAAEMRLAYADVMRSVQVTGKKKVSLSLQMAWPKGYEWCKGVYRRINGRA